MFAFAGGADHVDLAADPVDHRPDGRVPGLSGFRREPGPVADLDGDELAGQRYRVPVEEDVVDEAGGEIDRVDLVVVDIVVGGGPAEISIEPSHHGERRTDPEVPVEVEDAGHDDLRFVIAGIPGQMGVSEEDGAAGPGPARRQRPGVGSIIGLIESAA